MNGLFLVLLVLNGLRGIGFAQNESANKLTTPLVFHAVKLDTILAPVDQQGKPLKDVPLNKLTRFLATCSTCSPSQSRDLTLLKWDAVMPGHGHGMVTRPKITRLKTGEFLIEGIKFHMPGEWKISMKWQLGQELLEVAMPLNL